MEENESSRFVLTFNKRGPFTPHAASPRLLHPLLVGVLRVLAGSGNHGIIASKRYGKRTHPKLLGIDKRFGGLIVWGHADDLEHRIP